MKFLKLGLFFTVLTLFVFACTQNQTTNTNVANNTAVVVNSNANMQPATTPDELASARKIYSEKCIKCHKEDGTGGVTDIEGTKIKAPNFTSDKLKKEPDSEFIEMIEKGAKEDGMPAFKGKISDEEIKNLVKYIRREFQGK
jgi:mono/diheme cytochrome c family protein